MTKPRKLHYLQLVAVAIALAGCTDADSQTPAASATKAVVASDHAPVTTSAQGLAKTAPVENVSKDRVLRAMTCQIVLSQNVSVAMMNNAETGLPADLVSRLKVSAIARWEKFAQGHAQAAGVHDSDRAELVTQLNKLSSTDKDRQHTIDTVRDCLDNEV